MKRQGVVFAACVLGLSWFLALAPAAPDEAAGEPEEEEVVVTARRRKETRAVVPESTSVITRQDIERSNAQNVVDLLNREPGVFVNRQGGLGYGGNVQVRGLGGSPPSRSLVLVDGHPDFMGIMGHSMPSAYLLDNVERIEIVRGPASGMYGTNSTGGLIHIISRRPEGPFTAQGWVEAGSFGTRNLQGRLAGSSGPLALSLSAGRRETDGHIPGGYARYEADNLALTLEQRWSEAATTRFNGSAVSYDTIDQRKVASAYWAGNAIPLSAQRFDRRDLGITTEWNWANSSADLTFYYNPSRHRFEDGFHSRDHVAGLSWSHHLSQNAPLRPAWGIDLQQYGGKIKNPAPSRGSFDRKEGAAYGALEWQLPSGARFSGALRVQAVEDFDPHWLPSLGAVVPALGGSVRASLKHGYRTPSFRELFLFGVNNPNLRPETTRQLELGFHRDFAGQGEVDAALFTIRASDLIQMGPRPAGLPGNTPNAWVNAPATRLSGAELNVRRAITPSLSGYLNYSYLNPGAARAYNAMHKGGLGGDFARGRLRLSADLQWYDRLWGVDKASKVVRVPGFLVANARLRYQVGSQYDLWVGVENLFDREYVLDPSFPYAMPGRAVTVGVRARR